ncbi:hypothetical protein BCR42DRAFT_424331 [Absidia repens]|uniref:BZIP domain-containing protein n=1 Tax=Absidia repens TaxID=90262 RepID=A0A1X2I420_9FUNG|nr:hypothetical protein BCR42DRAFT_424331 [Absidia repens]
MSSSDSSLRSKANVNKRTSSGRRRTFSTEQRKDRNRQAQAAFRERRSQTTKTLKETILELQSTVEQLQQSIIEANGRAEKAEQRCQILQDEIQYVNTSLSCFLTSPSLPCYTSPQLLQSSTISPVTNMAPIYQQESWTPTDTKILSTLLLNQWNKSCDQDLPIKPISVNFLGESTF